MTLNVVLDYQPTCSLCENKSTLTLNGKRFCRDCMRSGAAVKSLARHKELKYLPELRT
jgi:hypothetical protein